MPNELVMDKPLHADLARGRWHTLPLAEQLGNIGSEISRANRWREKDEERFRGAVNRAFELFDLTLQDPRWRRAGRLQEIARAEEVFADALTGGTEYKSSLDDLLCYLDHFALLSRRSV